MFKIKGNSIIIFKRLAGKKNIWNKTSYVFPEEWKQEECNEMIHH